MDPVEQIKTLQRMVVEGQQHLEQLIAEVSELRLKVEIPRDMQQEANLNAVKTAEAYWAERLAEAARHLEFRDHQFGALDAEVERLEELLAVIVESADA